MPDPRRPILLANELGRGFGHAYKLLLVARALARAGERPVLVLPDPAAARALGGDFEILPAPPLERAAVSPPLANMGDILAAAGLADGRAARVVVGHWQTILARLQPALVIGDYAPFLSIAAYRRLPRVALGNGFTLPPANLPGYPGFADDRVVAHPEVERILSELLGVDRPAAPALLAGERHFVCVLPELDVFAGLRNHPAVGPLEDPPEVMGPTEGARSTFFAYLAGSAPQCAPVLAALAQSGRPGAVHVRGGTLAMQAALQGTAVRWCPQPVPMDQALRESALIVHHGGPNTAQRALLAGRPQLLVPETVEQVMQAAELEGMEVARSFPPEALAAEEVAATLVAMTAGVTGQRWAEAAGERGSAIGRRYPLGRAPEVVAAARALIAG